MTVEYIFAPGTNNETIIDDSQLISHNPVKTHTGKADATARLAVSDTVKNDIDGHARRQDRVNIALDGQIEWTGYLLASSRNERTGELDIQLDGIAKRLEETRPNYDLFDGSIDYEDIALEDALVDYWARTPFNTVSVTPQSTETIADDEFVQGLQTNSDFENALTLSATDPVAIRNDRLETLQTCWTTEAEEYDAINGDFQPEDDTAASDGQGIEIVQDKGNYLEYDFVTEHDIAGSEWITQLRAKNVGSGTSPPIYGIYIDGNKLGEADSITSTGYEWTVIDSGDPAFALPEIIEAGSHTLRLEVEFTGDTIRWDVVAPADGRYDYTLDNAVDANGYLSGPELYPDAVPVRFDEINVSYNLTGARIEADWKDDNVANDQAISLSNDSGDTFVTTTNSQTADVSFSTVGRALTQQPTLSRYGSRLSPTPTSGFLGQAIDQWGAFVDGDSLTVIDNLSLTRNHFENLKTLHNRGDYVWVISHDDSDIADMTVSSFEEGDETKPAPPEFDNPQNQQSEIQASNYYNAIFVQGRETASGRPTAEVADQDAINNDGRKISPGVLRDPRVATEAGAVFRARSLLQTAVQNNNYQGSVTVPLITDTDPGFAREIDLGGGGSAKTVEEVSLTEDPQTAQVRFRFGLPEELSEDISNLKRNARDLSDTV